ncbi:MAG: hypothetical protein AAFQ41_12085 [Cyanobacteria bacterium J06623_7]
MSLEINYGRESVAIGSKRKQGRLIEMVGNSFNLSVWNVDFSSPRLLYDTALLPAVSLLLVLLSALSSWFGTTPHRNYRWQYGGEFELVRLYCQHRDRAVLYCRQLWRSSA